MALPNKLLTLQYFNFLTLWIKSKLGPTALGVGFGFATMLLRRRLEGAQTADLLENALGIQLVLQPLQRAIDGLTFGKLSLPASIITPDFSDRLLIGERDPTRGRRPRQICSEKRLRDRYWRQTQR